LLVLSLLRSGFDCASVAAERALCTRKRERTTTAGRSMLGWREHRNDERNTDALAQKTRQHRPLGSGTLRKPPLRSKKM
jgi:hypothetical protein